MSFTPERAAERRLSAGSGFSVVTLGSGRFRSEQRDRSHPEAVTGPAQEEKAPDQGGADRVDVNPESDSDDRGGDETNKHEKHSSHRMRHLIYTLCHNHWPDFTRRLVFVPGFFAGAQLDSPGERPLY